MELRRRRFIAAGIFVAAIGLFFGIAHMTTPTRDAGGCQSNLKQLHLAMMQYLRDYDERFPLAKNWSDALQPYRHKDINLVRCPARDDLPFGYALHAGVVGLSMAEVAEPKTTIMYFDSDAGKPDRTDRGTSLPSTPRHPRGHSIAFIDGHVEFVKVPDFKLGYDPAQIAELRKQYQQQQREAEEEMNKQKRQNMQQRLRMKLPVTPEEMSWLRQDNLRRQKELAK